MFFVKMNYYEKYYAKYCAKTLFSKKKFHKICICAIFVVILQRKSALHRYVSSLERIFRHNKRRLLTLVLAS